MASLKFRASSVSIAIIIYLEYSILFNMSLKTKIMNMVTSHPKLVTFGIGLAITFVIGTAIGMIEHNQAFAFLNNFANSHNHNHQS